MDCEHFEKCGIIVHEFDELKKSDTLQEASLKSLHKRLDKVVDNVSELKDLSQENHHDLKEHMTWEEAKEEARLEALKEEEKKKAFRFKIYMSIIAGVFAIASTFTSYMFSKTQENSANIISLTGASYNTQEDVQEIKTELRDLNKFLRTGE